MTKQQFETHGFSINTKIKYKGKKYFILSVDFDAGLVEISEIDPTSDIHIEDEKRISVFYYACDIVNP